MQDEWVFSSDLSFRFLKHLLSSTVSEWINIQSFSQILHVKSSLQSSVFLHPLLPILIACLGRGGFLECTFPTHPCRVVKSRVSNTARMQPENPTRQPACWLNWIDITPFSVLFTGESKRNHTKEIQFRLVK